MAVINKESKSRNRIFWGRGCMHWSLKHSKLEPKKLGEASCVVGEWQKRSAQRPSVLRMR